MCLYLLSNDDLQTVSLERGDVRGSVWMMLLSLEWWQTQTEWLTYDAVRFVNFTTPLSMTLPQLDVLGFVSTGSMVAFIDYVSAVIVVVSLSP